MNTRKKVIIIGAGPAGIGLGIALQQIGITSFAILEKHQIGNSFQNWPETTRFITPSFTTNGFGYPDLNAVSPNTSPAFTLNKERLTGKEYQSYLKMIQEFYELPLYENTEITSVEQKNNSYQIQSVDGNVWEADYVVMATGEFSFPDKNGIIGSEFTIGYEQLRLPQKLHDEQIVLGGNESSIDLALTLAERGCHVKIFTTTSGLKSKSADPSISLSPHTKERLLNNPSYRDKIQIFENHKVVEVKKTTGGYFIYFKNRERIFSANKPFRATGFDIRENKLMSALFHFNGKQVQLSKLDESTRKPNIFLVGPSVQHKNTVFCYIYKFRQRFMVIANEISKRENLPISPEVIDNYKENKMYLENCNSVCVDCSC